MIGVVLDMEGVLHVDWEPLPGAVEAVAVLQDAGHRVAVLTNTTTRTREEVAEALGRLGVHLPLAHVVTAAAATARHVRATVPGGRALVLAERGALRELDGIELCEDETADVVIVGGPDESFSYARLDLAFRALHRGATLVAMHENRWWMTRAGPRLDAGAFVRGLAYAADLEPMVVGKPAPAIFLAACGVLDLPPDACVMVGDDLSSDVLAARAAGLRGVLVRTGKGASAAGDPRLRDVDAVLESVAELPAWLSEDGGSSPRRVQR